MATTTVSPSRARRPRRPPGRPAPATVPGGSATILLYRNAVWLVVAFGIAMLVAFWPSYFSRPGAQATYHVHAHALALSLWCALLVVQAWLIRAGRRPLHRQAGRLVYPLVALVVVTTVHFLHFRLRGAPIDAVALYFMALVLNALVAFLVIVGLAMYHRRQPAVHARFMVCTVFPFFTPVTDRLFGAYVPSIVPMVPRIEGVPVLPVAGFVVASAILAALAVWDWRASRRLDVFPVALGVVLLYQVSVVTLHRLVAWQAFGAWFAALPLS